MKVNLGNDKINEENSQEVEGRGKTVKSCGKYIKGTRKEMMETRGFVMKEDHIPVDQRLRSLAPLYKEQDNPFLDCCLSIIIKTLLEYGRIVMERVREERLRNM